MNSFLKLVCVPVFFLAGCNGRLTVSVTDAPIDSAESVTVKFTGVDLIQPDGDVDHFDFATPKSIDLAALEGGQRATLLDDAISTDDYAKIRLNISADGSGDDSWIQLEDGRHPLLLDEADEDLLTISHSFSGSPSEDLHFTVDFDLRKSVRPPAGGSDIYSLVPALRVVENSKAGSVTGTVAASLIGESCVPAVYVYTREGADPDDVGSANGPLNSSRVKLDGAVWRYKVGLLPKGPYTAALTCEADLDDPEEDDAVEFIDQQNVTVEAEHTATADFQAPE